MNGAKRNFIESCILVFNCFYGVFLCSLRLINIIEMIYNTFLKKLSVEMLDKVNYYLEIDGDFLQLNQLINKRIEISYLGQIKCFCNNVVRETFKENFCKKCYFTLPQTGESVFFPEKSKAHLGIQDRDLEWEKLYQLQPHTVYLAYSGMGVKVGVSRSSKLINRWIDQGADYAMVFAEMQNRYLAGVLESEMKSYISDKTNWQKMLKNSIGIKAREELLKARESLLSYIPYRMREYIVEESNIQEIKYPHNDILDKITSINFTKESEIKGILTGIKGQYLIFDKQKVFNVRRHEGYGISLNIL